MKKSWCGATQNMSTIVIGFASCSRRPPCRVKCKRDRLLESRGGSSGADRDSTVGGDHRGEFGVRAVLTQYSAQCRRAFSSMVLPLPYPVFSLLLCPLRRHIEGDITSRQTRRRPTSTKKARTGPNAKLFLKYLSRTRLHPLKSTVRHSEPSPAAPTPVSFCDTVFFTRPERISHRT